MERQKILWIIFSVALFVLVVVGVGVIWFMPSNQSKVAEQATAKSDTNAKISFDPYEWAKTRNNNYPGLETAPTGGASGQSSGQSGGNFTIIYGQEPGQAAPPSEQTPPTSPAPKPSPPSAAPQAHAAPPASQPAPVRRTVSRAAPAPKPRAARPAPQRTVRVVQHWIQVAAYTSDFRAERAKKTLETNGITGKIMSREVHGRTFFRVRVGPYVTQQEAEKFLVQIKKISEFRNSYISLVYTTASAN